MKQGVEQFLSKFGPVVKAIQEFDSSRPLSAPGRGKWSAWTILAEEMGELVEAKKIADLVPIERLNGEKRLVRFELGDVGFGLAEIWRYFPVDLMSQMQLNQVFGALKLVKEVEQRYGLSVVQAGVEVVRGKNAINNPPEFLRDYHPLDSTATATERNRDVRAGLRKIRNRDEHGMFTIKNYERALEYFDYTSRAIAKSPTLATAFLRKIVYEGMID